MKESIAYPQKHKSMRERERESIQMELNLTILRMGIKERLTGKELLEKRKLSALNLGP